MSKQKTIMLMVQGGAGDVLAHTPAIRGMREKYPDDELVVLATHDHLLKYNKHIDRLISLMGNQEARQIYDDLIAQNFDLRFFRHHFLYDSLFDEVGKKSKTLPEYICNLYQVEYDGQPLDYNISQYEKDAATAFMQQFDKPIILLHLTGVLPMKSVDFNIITPIIQKHQQQYHFVQIGGSGEPEIPGTINALGMPMRDTISIMPHAKLCILIESVFAHVSSALNLGSVVIFQSTSPEFFGYENNINVWDSGDCEQWPCNRPIGPLNKFLPAYLDLKTGQPRPWMCPEPKCSRLKTGLLEKTIVGVIEEKESAGKTKKEGPHPDLESARQA
jgi:ADP-heptose:LPS heptosyltransferase